MPHAKTPPSELIEAIYDASLSPGAWTGVRRALERRFGGLAALWWVRGEPRSAIVACSNDAGDAAIDAYVGGLWREDAAMRALVAAPAGVIVRDSTLVDDTSRESSLFYGGYLCALGLPRGLYGNVLRDGDDAVVLGIHRPSREGDYGAADEAMMRRLVPHFQRSLTIQRRLQAAQLSADVTAQALESADIALATVDASARLRLANAAADEFLGGGGLTVRGGVVDALRPSGTRALHAAIADATRAHGAVAATLALPLLRRAGTITVRVSPVRPGAGGLAPAEPLALLLIGRDRAREIGPEVLGRAYGLTRAQARLLSALVAGERVADYAARTGIALATARTHVRGLMHKTGVRRQTDLVRKALADPVLGIGAPPCGDAPARPVGRTSP